MNFHHPLTALFASALMTFGMSQTSFAADANLTCTSDAMIVFDASGSMAATDVEVSATRIDVVRQALRKLLPPVSKIRKLGLVTYGPGKSDNACRNVELKFPPKADAGPQILSEVEKLHPAGNTPLTAAVKIAANALEQSPRPAAIVLLTDGDETCRNDPCLLAKNLRASYPGIVVHIIGFKLQGLQNKPPVSAAKCLADETGGYNANTNTLDELIAALSKTLNCPEVSAVTSPSVAR